MGSLKSSNKDIKTLWGLHLPTRVWRHSTSSNLAFSALGGELTLLPEPSSPLPIPAAPREVTHHLTHQVRRIPVTHQPRNDKFAPLKFSAVLGFYEKAWVTSAMIYVWSMFGENLLGAGSGVNTEQLPHKNCFPREFKGLIQILQACPAPPTR